jgi:hypothetical protein
MLAVAGPLRDFRHQAAYPQADEQPGHDPADGAEHPDQRELLFLRLDVMEGQAVGQAQGGHVAQVVEQQQDDEQRRLAAELRHAEHDHPAQQVEHPQHLLGGEVPVGHEAQEERRHDGRDRVDGVGPVGQRFHALLGHVDRDAGVPRAPHEKLEEHHDRQPCGHRFACRVTRPLRLRHGSTRIRMFR